LRAVADASETTGATPRVGAPWRAGVLAVAALGLMVAAYAFFAGTAAGRAADAAVLGQDLDGVWEPVAWPLILAVNPLTTALAALAIVMVALRQRRRQAAAFAVIAIAGAAATARGLKAALSAVDPFGTEAARELGAGFYPSGHAAAIMAMCLAALVALPPEERRRFVGVAAAAAAVLGCAVYATRGHHASDVVGGFALAAGCVFGALVALRGAAAAPARQAGRDPCGSWSPARWTVRLAVVAAVGVPFLAVVQAIGLPTGPLQPLLVLSWCAVAICAVGMTAALAWHLEGGWDAPPWRRLEAILRRTARRAPTPSPTQSPIS
jgi:membrane-associated phospholipid phosphatase